MSCENCAGSNSKCRMCKVSKIENIDFIIKYDSDYNDVWKIMNITIRIGKMKIADTIFLMEEK